MGFETRDKQWGNCDGRTYSYHSQDGGGRGPESAAPRLATFRRVDKPQGRWRVRRLQGEADCSTDFHTGRRCWNCRRTDYVGLLHRDPRCLRDCRNCHESSALAPRFCIPSPPGPELHNSHFCEPKFHSSHIGLGSPYPRPHSARLCYRRGIHSPTRRESLAAVGVLSPPRLDGCYFYF